MSKPAKRAQAVQANIYVARQGHDGPFFTIFQYRDADGHSRSVEFPAHLLETLALDAGRALSVMTREDPGSLIHPLLRNRS